MSATDVRKSIADAANTVEGVSVQPYFVQATRPGTGAVARGRTEYPDRFGGVVYWQVSLRLSQDVVTAEKWMDQNLPDLVEAIGEELIVTSATPVDIAFDGGTVPGIVIEGHRSEND